MEKLQQEIISLFKQEQSVSEIANMLHLKWDDVYDTIKEAKIPGRRYTKFSTLLTNRIVHMYENGMTTTTIGNEYVISHHAIRRLLMKNNIPIRSRSDYREYNIDQHYFDNVDTPNKAYILGFLFADGSNCMSKYTVTMSLQEDDRDILEKIRLEMHNERPLEFIDYSNKHDGGYNYKNQYRLLMFSTQLCQSLNNIGMVPNKSLTLEFPDINPSFYSHFIRGYFDGDGCVTHNIPNKTRLVTITSTENFCLKLQHIVQEILGITGTIVDASNHNGITKVYTIGSIPNIKKFLDFLYADAELFLERKYQRYLEYCN
ncbi:MAG: LAGLIDADG family homing endonuclease [Ruminococcus sp.]